MDLNYVFLRQQMERSMADAAAHEAARRAHEEMARAYEAEIKRISGGRLLLPADEEASADAATS